MTASTNERVTDAMQRLARNIISRSEAGLFDLVAQLEDADALAEKILEFLEGPSVNDDKR